MIVILSRSISNFTSYGVGWNLGSFAKFHGGVPVNSSSIPVAEPGLSSSTQFAGTLHPTARVMEHDGGSSSTLADASKLVQVCDSYSFCFSQF